jgi:TolA-binding protein
MATLLFLKKVWAFCKKYWWVFTAIVGFILYKLVFKSDIVDISETLNAIQQKHDEELKAIKEADETRRKAYEENGRKLQERLVEIERQYAEAQLQLDVKKRTELEKILQESHDDPEELAQKLSDATGFKVILP